MMRRGQRSFLQAAAVLGLAASLGLAPAQQEDPPNGLLLIAKPSLTDPSFARTVVLVTQTPDASTPAATTIYHIGRRLRLGFSGHSGESRSASCPPSAASRRSRDVIGPSVGDNCNKTLSG